MITTENQDMGPVYAILRDKARKIAASLPMADFYRIHAREIDLARQALTADQGLLAEIHALVRHTIENDFGHGLMHAHKVALDAGALVLIACERAGFDRTATERNLLSVQTAGLLHDMRRKEKQHAKAGALFAREKLAPFDFSPPEVDAICYAIRSHEAFQHIQPPPSIEAGLISDCLYDADKFRWGPDNFTDTLWDMVTFYNPPPIGIRCALSRGHEKIGRNQNDVSQRGGQTLRSPNDRFRYNDRPRTDEHDPYRIYAFAVRADVRYLWRMDRWISGFTCPRKAGAGSWRSS